MTKKLSTADMLLLAAAFLSLIFSEILWFKGEEKAAIFVGLWVPSILGFAVYFKLLNTPKKMIQLIPYFAGLITLLLSIGMFLAIKTKDET